MEAGAGAVGSLRRFALEFLNVVLAEFAQAQGVGLKNRGAGKTLVTASNRMPDGSRPTVAPPARSEHEPDRAFRLALVEY